MEKSGAIEHAYALNFGSGTAVATPKGYPGTVRLVRGGPWWQPPGVMAASQVP
jgi:hypothetical protein